MMIPICIICLPDGGHRALAPDLPGCQVEDPDAGNAFARLRLVIEGALTERLLGDRPMPQLQPPASWRADARYRDGRWSEVHMNLVHLRAVARHQRARGAA